jgi:hypothetical protein
VALIGIGLRVWAQLGWSDVVGRAVFFGLALLALYWATIVYTFKLSLALRVGPQGMAIVRGPWRTELRWSEITRLMERPQNVGGRRYRWVVALARDGRRIQAREDALLDYERFRREVYERYRLWRDHGGTWGSTGGGPFVAHESVGEEMRWWAILGLLIALPGIYCALLLPGAQIAGYVLLAVAILCIARVIIAYLRRRVYSVDGKMIQSRGLLQRTELAWREVVKVERAQSRAGGAILILVGVGRFLLRAVSRSDSGIRGFAWSPRAPEYLTLRGGGRQVRVRLHHLTHPEELAAWIDFYAGVRRSATSRPLAATDGGEVAGPDAGAPSAPLAGAGTAERRTQPDLSGAVGPLDPWGGDRSGEMEGEVVTAEFGAPSDLMDEPNNETGQVGHVPMPEPLFRGAPLSSTFREQSGLDQPPDTIDPEAGRSDDAWLRETSAHFRMNQPGTARQRGSEPSQPGGPRATPAPPAPPGSPVPPTPQAPQVARGMGGPGRRALDPAASAGFAASPGDQPPQTQQPQRAPRHSRQFIPPPGQRRPPVARDVTAGDASASQTPTRPNPHLPSQPTPSRPLAGFAPYSPDIPEGKWSEQGTVAGAPSGPVMPASQPFAGQMGQVRPMDVQSTAQPQPQPQPPYAPQPAPVSEPTPDEAPERADRGEIQPGSADFMNESVTASELPAAPWEDANWQPPTLPRFGPPATPTDESQRGGE